jgi:SAM-dependent methyltransferase
MSFNLVTVLRLCTCIDRRVSTLVMVWMRFFRHLFYFILLGDRGLQILTDLYYDTQEYYLDDEHNRRGFLPWEADVVEKHFPGGGRVLVTSCGAGREVLTLAERGYGVVGTECHPDLCRVAGDLSASLENVEIHCLPPPGVPPTDGTFDAVMVGWGGFTHLTPRARRVCFLQNLADRMKPGAPILVSYLGRPRKGQRSITLARWIANVIRTLTLRRALEPGDMISVGFCHCFLPGEAPEEARDAGLEILTEAHAPPGFHGGQYPHFVARKPGKD